MGSGKSETSDAKTATTVVEEKLKEELCRDLGGEERLHYYQGFHDIASVLLIVAGQEIAMVCSMLERIASWFVRDAMRPNFAQLSLCLDVVFPLVATEGGRRGSRTYEALRASGVQPIITLPWVITWFAHDVKDLGVVERLYDAFLCSHPALPLYTAAALLLRGSDKIISCAAETAYRERDLETGKIVTRSDMAYGAGEWASAVAASVSASSASS